MISIYKEEFAEIGFIRKGHGYKGHARIVVFEDFQEDLIEQKFVFLEIDGYKVPFKIEERIKGKELILKFKYIDSSEELAKYHKAPFFLLKKDVSYKDDNKSKEKISNFVGYKITDKSIGLIGEIVRIDEYPQQDMAIIQRDDKIEILIPLHPTLILQIDEVNKIIKMDLPEGLV